jgi:hypothetical protein
MPSSGELLDSARHKLRLARYHADAVRAVLVQHPSEDPEDALRVALEAHLEGLAYTGTAAAEKTLRSLDPDALSDPRLDIASMLRIAKADVYPGATRDLASRFERWWYGAAPNGARYAPIARDLRNDAAHRVYEKAPDGPAWRMEITGQRDPILLADFVAGYEQALDQLDQLVSAVEEIAAHAPH